MSRGATRWECEKTRLLAGETRCCRSASACLQRRSPRVPARTLPGWPFRPRLRTDSKAGRSPSWTSHRPMGQSSPWQLSGPANSSPTTPFSSGVGSIPSFRSHFPVLHRPATPIRFRCLRDSLCARDASCLRSSGIEAGSAQLGGSAVRRSPCRPGCSDGVSSNSAGVKKAAAQ